MARYSRKREKKIKKERERKNSREERKKERKGKKVIFSSWNRGCTERAAARSVETWEIRVVSVRLRCEVVQTELVYSE